MAKANTQTKAQKATEVVAPVETKETKKAGKKTTEPVVEATPAPVVETKESKKSKKTAEPVVEATPVKETKESKKGGKKAAAEPVVEAVVEAVVETKKGGAKKSTKKESTKEEVVKAGPRYFRCVYKTTDGDIIHAGRYSGKKPKQAACKALTGIVKNNGLETGEKVVFLIQECTRGSKKKKYSYVGQQVDLKEPVKIKITKKDGSTSEIEYTKNNEVKKVSLSECGDLMNVDLPEDQEEDEVKLQRAEKKVKAPKAKAAAKAPAKSAKGAKAPAKVATKAKAKKA